MKTTKPKRDAGKSHSDFSSAGLPAGPEVQDLQQRLCFETLLTELSAKFVNLPTEKTDQEIVSSLEEIGHFLKLDRINVAQFFDNLSRLEITHSWAAPGLKTYIGLQLNDNAPWYYRQIRKGESIILTKLPDDLPAVAREEREWNQKEGFKSQLGLPLIVGGKLLGCLMFMTFKEGREWHPPLIDRHRLISEIFSNVLMRNYSEQKLRMALEEIQSLKKTLEKDYKYVCEEIQSHHNHNEIIGSSPALKHVLEQVQVVASTDASVLIMGETGTGKDLIARAIHNLGKRASRPLVKVNCAALPASLIESELFGHEKGAFTNAHARQVGRFELAHGATLFLDEIGELPIEVQAKLLNVLQYGQFERLGNPRTIQVDVRIIAATNRDLEAIIHKGTFRKDLWYRLNIFPITLPPLRERVDDIPQLAHWFAVSKGQKMGKNIKNIRASDIRRMQKYSWLGNVRELENVIERAVILNKGETLKLDQSLITLPEAKEDHTEKICSLAKMEKTHIVKALAATGWRVSGPKGAAGILQINPSTLRARMRKLGITRPEL